MQRRLAVTQLYFLPKHTHVNTPTYKYKYETMKHTQLTNHKWKVTLVNINSIYEMKRLTGEEEEKQQTFKIGNNSLQVWVDSRIRHRFRRSHNLAFCQLQSSFPVNSERAQK